MKAETNGISPKIAIVLIEAFGKGKLSMEEMNSVLSPTSEIPRSVMLVLLQAYQDEKIEQVDIASMLSQSNHGTTQPDTTPSLEETVTEWLYKMGIPANIKGYGYLRSAISACVEDSSMINAVTKQLYPKIAEEFETTSSRVERAIRHAIEVAWGRGDSDVQMQIFGHTVSAKSGKPTNSEFIAMLTDRIRLDRKKA